MAKNKQPHNGNEQKVQTKYDRKMEQRKKQAEKEKRESRIMSITAIAVVVLLVAVIAGSVIVSVMNKRAVTKDAYITVGNHEVTKVEYDYYYTSVYNNYASLLSYMGMDSGSDLESQQYSDDMTWKDFFDETAVEQIKQMKALSDDAQAKGFEYDVTEDYANTMTSVKSGAESAGVTLAEFYKATYGEYATEQNMEDILKEGLRASAYYEQLKEDNAPAEQEIKDYYEQNAQSYDKVDYKSFIFTADTAEDASQEDIAKAMEEAKVKADDMLAAVEGGADFRQLCFDNAAEDEKSKYEDAENDGSVTEGVYYSSSDSAVADWLYEDGRTQGDRTVIEDTDNNRYYVLEFVNRYYDEADDANISDTIASQRVTEYVNTLKENYEVVRNQ